MPIHDFGQFKKIEDVEKEVDNGDAKEIREVKIEKSALFAPSGVQMAWQEMLNDEKKDKNEVKEIQKEKSKRPKNKIKADHPMVCGSLEIEEEEL